MGPEARGGEVVVPEVWDYLAVDLHSGNGVGSGGPTPARDCVPC